MPLFVITCLDKPDSLALRLATRPIHLDYVKDFETMVKLGGPLLDDDGKPCGTMMVIEAPDREAAAAVPAHDPYALAGLFESVTVRPWSLVFGDLS